MNDKRGLRRRYGAWGLVGAVLLSLLALAPARAAGGASDWFVTDQGQVRLVAASPSVGDRAALDLGLQFRLAPHWKIYWRSPGDAGYPPHLDWAGSTNLAGTQMAWPAPRRFSVQGLETVGYTGDVVFPIAARLVRPGEATRLRLALSYLTCSNICVPYNTVLTLDVPAGPPPAGGASYGALIARYAARVPGDGRGSGLALAAAVLVPGRKPVLELRVDTAAPLLAPDAFVEGPAEVAFGAPHLAATDSPGQALLRIPVSAAPRVLDRLVGHPLAVTLVDGDRMLAGTIAPVAGPPPADFGLLLRILPLALLGGFILNFMPCVLPVLSIKLLSVVGLQGKPRAVLRRGFLATGAGVILSFLVLAAAMVGLKSAGVAAGWGVQFQQPLFLVFMVALLTLFAANLWDAFEVPLPAWLAAVGSHGDGATLLGNIAVGAFATLLATPCSAPFLGTAVGFALAAGPFEILAVFLALGLGLAAPYLLVAALPRLAEAMPRPGRWMLVLRRVLGLALAATALWLVAVLASEIGLAAAATVGALMVASAAALVVLRRPAARRGWVAALVLASFFVPAVLASPPALPAASGAFWHPFDRAEIDRLVRRGDVVFVDVTADWCLTCKVNKELVIDQPEVRRRLDQPGTVAMRADWTRPSDAIAAYLRSFGRYGIPFNAVYGPALPQGRALSEILTPDQVLQALADAADPGKVAGALP
jgi:suppressor for copper-sensitivity B